MPRSLASRAESAWNKLWSSEGPHHVAQAMKSGTRAGHTWFRPIAPATFRRTGPVVLLNQEPWGSVDLDLHDNEISQLDSLIGNDFAFDPSTGQFSATVRFDQLKYTGKYTLRRGQATGSAFRHAMTSLRATPAVGAANDAVLEAPPPGDDQNITLAEQYQQQLTTTDSGRFMLSTYYANNDAYAQIYQNSVFVRNWRTHQTNGKTTSVFASQTSTAAVNPGGPAVNGDPDYDVHALAMQILVVATCNAQGNQDAATAASTFQSNTQAPSQQPQTVNNVLTVVASSTPPSLTMLRKGAMANMAPAPEPPALVSMRASLADQIAAIEKEEDDVRSGLLLREQTGRPIEGDFRAYFGTQNFTLTGSIQEGANGPAVQIDKLSGPAPDVRVQLGVFPGSLHPEVEKALDRANFLKAVLGQRVLAALNDQKFLGYLSRILASAIRDERGDAQVKETT